MGRVRNLYRSSHITSMCFFGELTIPAGYLMTGKVDDVDLVLLTELAFSDLLIL